MLKNYTYNHIYLLNVFVMLNQKRFMLDEMTTRKMANFEEFSLVNNNILLISEECNTLGKIHTNDTQIRFLQEVLNWNINFTDHFCSQFILIFDTKAQNFGIMTHRNTKKFIPLWTQVVIDNLYYQVKKIG